MKKWKNVTVYPLVVVPNSELVEIGEYSEIDDFVFMYAKNGIEIGKYCHIATGVKVIGQGRLEMGDYSVLAQNVVILTSTNDYKGGYHMSATSPVDQQSIRTGVVKIGKDAFVGAGSIVHPNVTIGEGAIIGTHSLILRNIEPWTINVGSPCRIIGKRDKVIF